MYFSKLRPIRRRHQTDSIRSESGDERSADELEPYQVLLRRKSFSLKEVVIGGSSRRDTKSTNNISVHVKKEVDERLMLFVF